MITLTLTTLTPKQLVLRNSLEKFTFSKFDIVPK